MDLECRFPPTGVKVWPAEDLPMEWEGSDQAYVHLGAMQTTTRKVGLG